MYKVYNRRIVNFYKVDNSIFKSKSDHRYSAVSRGGAALLGFNAKKKM